jgi:hypothetical protein
MLYNMLGRGPAPGSPRATYHRKPLPPRDVQGRESALRHVHLQLPPYFLRPLSEAWLARWR